jgi:hypothetical protein
MGPVRSGNRVLALSEDQKGFEERFNIVSLVFKKGSLWL